MPVVAKVQFEPIIYDQLYLQYLTKNSFRTSHQSVVPCIHSTLTALVAAADSWAMNIDRGFVNTVFLYPKRPLMQWIKIKYYGICRSSYKWSPLT